MKKRLNSLVYNNKTLARKKGDKDYTARENK